MPHETELPETPHDPRMGFFEELAARWDTIGQDPAATVEHLAAIANLLDLQPGTDLLEVGCGTGQITGWLADQVAPGRVVAVDFAAGMLEQARRKNLRAEFRWADVCRDSLGERCFDVVLCFHSFPHFRDQRAALQHLARALRDNGRLIVLHLAGSAQVNAFHDHVGGAVAGDHLPCPHTWKGLLRNVGLEVRQRVDRDDLFFLRLEAGGGRPEG